MKYINENVLIKCKIGKCIYEKSIYKNEWMKKVMENSMENDCDMYCCNIYELK